MLRYKTSSIFQNSNLGEEEKFTISKIDLQIPFKSVVTNYHPPLI